MTPKQFALQVTQQLQEAGYEALWAGGCVRDQLLGFEPKDYDVATNAKPDEIRQLFGYKRTLPLGAAFGVITVVGPKSAGHVEVATFRSDGPYSDGRRPDEVVFSTAEFDAHRRDFTINGLFYDPVQEKVIDYVDGQRDLESGMIRGIGNPDERIHEDKLRMLRAVRFAATYGFDIDPVTLTAVKNHAADILMVSAERISAELRRMLTHRNRRLAVELMLESTLMKWILPDVVDVFRETEVESLTLRILDDLPRSNFALCFAALLMPIEDAENKLKPIGVHLKLSNEEIEQATWIIRVQGVLEHANRMKWSKVQPILTNPVAPLALALLETRLTAGDRSTDVVRFCHDQLALPAEELDPPQLIDGQSLKALGLQPGPQFSKILQTVRNAQLDGEIFSEEEALEIARKIAT